jgi:DNA polymerase IIIc chi subunit
MTADVLRKKIYSIIDDIPDRSLPALKPLLTHLADDYWKPVIEPASPEEIKMINERLKDYEADPSSFVPFKKRKKG